MRCYIQSYNIIRKTFNWTRKTGIHLIHRLVLNAFILYKQTNDDRTFLTFILHYARHLFESTGIGRKAGRKSERPRILKEVLQNHVPRKLHPSEKKTNPSLRCRMCQRVIDRQVYLWHLFGVCTSNGIRRETRLFCDSCECKPPMCDHHPCFNVSND